MEGKSFSKEEIKELHREKIKQIIFEHEPPAAVEILTDYLMSRIGTVISYERKKWERLLAKRDAERERSSINGQGNNRKII